jgi:hypothetical protein
MLKPPSMNSLRWLTVLIGFGVVACGAEAPAEDIAIGEGAASEDAPSFVCVASHAIGRVEDGEPAGVTNVRVAGHESFDRVVLDLAAGTAAEEVIVSKNDGLTFTGEADEDEFRNGPPEVDGNVALHVLIRGSQPTGEAPRDVRPTDTKNIRHVRSFGAFEGDHDYLIGLEREGCYRTFMLKSPSRIVIDVQHGAPGTPGDREGGAPAAR